MNVRYAPQALARIKEYQADLELRVEAGALTREESVTLLAARLHQEAEGGEPRKVRCPSCQRVHTFIGRSREGTFTCGCSPSVKRSVWDCRVTP